MFLAGVGLIGVIVVSLPATSKPESVRVSNLTKFGMVCPVDIRLAFTARHVVTPSQDSYSYLPTFWGTPDGSRLGVLKLVYIDSRRDLAVVESDTDFPVVYTLAEAVPPVGSKVYITTPDWFDSGLRVRTKTYKVASYIADMLVTSNEPAVGASGGCVFDEQGKVVAIHTGYINGRGLSLVIAGGRHATPEEFREGGTSK